MTRISRMDSLAGVHRAADCPTIWMIDVTRQIRQALDALPFSIGVIREIRGDLILTQGLRLLFLA